MKIILLSVNPHIYSTDRIAEEIENQGHEVWVVNHLECTILLKNGKPSIIYDGEDIIDYPDIIVPRIGASATRHGASVVKQFEMNGVLTTATSEGVVNAQNKASTLQIMNKHRIAIPNTIFSVNSDDIDNQIKLLGGAPLVVKLHQGTQGVGVMLADSNKSVRSIVETMFALEQQILLQEYVKESNAEDVRIIVAGNKVIAAMKRKGVKGDFRSNIHRGGVGSRVELTKEEKSIAIDAVRHLGLSIAGVDLLRSAKGPLLLEVNSTPGLQGVEEYTDTNVAAEITKHIVDKCLKKSLKMKL